MAVDNSGGAAAAIGVGDGGGRNERICLFIVTTNQASGFADARFVGG